MSEGITLAGHCHKATVQSTGLKAASAVPVSKCCTCLSAAQCDKSGVPTIEAAVAGADGLPGGVCGVVVLEEVGDRQAQVCSSTLCSAWAQHAGRQRAGISGCCIMQQHGNHCVHTGRSQLHAGAQQIQSSE